MTSEHDIVYGIAKIVFEGILDDDALFVARGSLEDIQTAYDMQGGAGKHFILWAAAWQIRNGPFGFDTVQTSRGKVPVTMTLRQALGPVGKGAWEEFLDVCLTGWRDHLGGDDDADEAIKAKLGDKQLNLGGPYPWYKNESPPQRNVKGDGTKKPLINQIVLVDDAGNIAKTPTAFTKKEGGGKPAKVKTGGNPNKGRNRTTSSNK